MRNKTYFSLSVEKGLRGNIGKMTFVETSKGETYMNVMLFLVANNGSITDDRLHQIVNIHFPKEAFETLKAYSVSDYVRVHFDRIDLSKGIDTNSGQEKISISVKANSIELLKKAEKKSKEIVQSVSYPSSEKPQATSANTWSQLH